MKGRALDIITGILLGAVVGIYFPAVGTYAPLLVLLTLIAFVHLVVAK